MSGGRWEHTAWSMDTRGPADPQAGETARCRIDMPPKGHQQPSPAKNSYETCDRLLCPVHLTRDDLLVLPAV